MNGDFYERSLTIIFMNGHERFWVFFVARVERVELNLRHPFMNGHERFWVFFVARVERVELNLRHPYLSASAVLDNGYLA